MPPQQAPNQIPFAGAQGKFFTLQQFGSLNTKAGRPSIGDQEFSWLENMMPIGDGNMRTLYSQGSSIFTAAGGLTIIYVFFFNINATTYAAVFLSDGTAIQVNTQTLGQTVITSAPGTFFPGSSVLGNPAPACAQYGQSGIIIVTTAATNGYYAWDGTTLYGPGSAAPNWLTNTTPTTMPTGVSGTAVEIYSNRVWTFQSNIGSFSAPGNGANFSGASGGGTFKSNDSFLRREFTQAKQANGFLYTFADSSINVISNVQTVGSSTTFNNQNVDPQVGTPWHSSVQAFGRGLILANSVGVYALVGGATEKVSDQLDGIFQNSHLLLLVEGSASAPSSAVAVVFDIKVYLLLVPVKDLFTGQFRKALVMWDGRKWMLASQDKSLTYIATQEIDSVLTAWGTDGIDLFPLFQNSSNTLRKLYQTRLWPGNGWQVTKQAMRLYTMGNDMSGVGYTITGTVDYLLENQGLATSPITITSGTGQIIWKNNSNGTIQFVNSLNQAINFTVQSLSISGFDAGFITQRGNLLGLTLQSTSPDFTLIAHSMLYQEQSPLGA